MAQRETDRLNQILTGAALSRAVSCIAEFGIADLIEQGTPQPAAALAKASGLHEQALYRVLRYLASHAIFVENENGEFDHTPLSYVLRSNAEGSYRAGARMFYRMYPGWSGLDHSLRTGEPGFNQIFGKPIFEHVMANPDMGPILDAGMTCIHGYETAAMLDVYDFSGIDVLADIGGGNGSLISAVLERYPAMRGMLVDLWHVVARSKANIAAKGLAERCVVQEGNFFTSIPAGANTYLFRHIIHDWTDEQSIQILRNCRAVIPADGRVLLVECVVPKGNGPTPAKDFDMTMMVFPGGAERTEEEFRALLERSGFALTSVTPTATMVSIVEGRPV